MALNVDFITLLVVIATNLVAISATLPMIMGRDLSSSARNVQAYMVVQALAWMAIIASNLVPDTLADRVLSTACIAFGVLAQWLLFRALDGWLGPRKGRNLALLLAVSAPVGYFLGFDSYAFRVGWANFFLAAMMLVVARACLGPVLAAGRGWRWLLFVCLIAMAALLLGRGYLGAFTASYPSFSTPHPVNLAFAIASNIIVVLTVIALLVPWRDEAEQKLRAMALTDALTGLPNRRCFEQRATGMLALARRQNLPLCAVMLDLDHFKHINDTHGHEGGDNALRLFAQVLQQCCRHGELPARVGGEEFCVLLSGDEDSAEQLDQRLRAQLPRRSQEALGFLIDFSAGVALLQPDDTGMEPLLARADAALYLAKAQGRGQLQHDSV